MLGRKIWLNKQYNPLDPKYVISTKSNRKMIIGDIEANKPKKWFKRELNKDSKRYLRVDDIPGATPKELFNIPEEKLP